LIRKSLIEYLGKLESPNAWELGKAFFSGAQKIVASAEKQRRASQSFLIYEK
jgi:hypothetical protein